MQQLCESYFSLKNGEYLLMEPWRLRPSLVVIDYILTAICFIDLFPSARRGDSSLIILVQYGPSGRRACEEHLAQLSSSVYIRYIQSNFPSKSMIGTVRQSNILNVINLTPQALRD